MRNQTLILVDSDDKLVGYASLGECHSGQGKQHRAFMTLVFDKSGKVILQKRKHRLFDGLWDFTGISHNLHLKDHDESYQEASDRTLKKEVGIDQVKIKQVGGFNYFAKDGDNCENEYCAILVGRYSGKIRPNPAEVYEVRKMAFGDFLKDVAVSPKKYTSWTVLAVKELEKLNLEKLLKSE